jgi:hypothetical protein
MSQTKSRIVTKHCNCLQCISFTHTAKHDAVATRTSNREQHTWPLSHECMLSLLATWTPHWPSCPVSCVHFDVFVMYNSDSHYNDHNWPRSIHGIPCLAQCKNVATPSGNSDRSYYSRDWPLSKYSSVYSLRGWHVNSVARIGTLFITSLRNSGCKFKQWSTFNC